jgi:hypothetical protein
MRSLPASGALLCRALDCAAIRHQKLATVRQQVFAGHVMHGPHEISISFGRVFVLRFQCGSA